MILTLTYLLVFGPAFALAQTACTAQNAKGTCIATSSCSGTSVAGLCPGAANIQCCIPKGTACTANGKSGSCIATSSCAGTSVAGLCPGAANIQCCVAAGGTSGSSSGLCGSYVGAAVSSIKGNNNVMYSVVKIRQEHLTNPGIYSSAPTAADNTMTTSTACAFDKMASVAEHAARPGTSNHGRGVALDLNTNCGSQNDAEPNCGGSSVYQWLKNNGHQYGFKRTVQSEQWHWEFRGVGVCRTSFS
ncbi:unnamed protein product [Rotaria socialis]|uniref:D-alanyl-D-alanine carboxypeptidase-like core domain-containing protein n=1 Tax=Rotaria socialis TaxID=392032 RepID=A0A820W1B7_9BILA|nr:unnamed protein product [Rotaria socialis]